MIGIKREKLSVFTGTNGRYKNGSAPDSYHWISTTYFPIILINVVAYISHFLVLLPLLLQLRNNPSYSNPLVSRCILVVFHEILSLLTSQHFHYIKRPFNCRFVYVIESYSKTFLVKRQLIYHSQNKIDRCYVV